MGFVPARMFLSQTRRGQSRKKVQQSSESYFNGLKDYAGKVTGGGIDWTFATVKIMGMGLPTENTHSPGL